MQLRRRRTRPRSSKRNKCLDDIRARAIMGAMVYENLMHRFTGPEIIAVRLERGDEIARSIKRILRGRERDKRGRKKRRMK